MKGKLVIIAILISAISTESADNKSVRKLQTHTNCWYATPHGLYLNDSFVPIYGINWFGMETPDRAPHGLWVNRTVDDFLQQIIDLGFNALRLPLSPEVLYPGYTTPSWAQNVGYPADARDGLEYFLQRAEAKGLYVLLCFHTFDPDSIAGNLPGKPFNNVTFTKQQWLDALTQMANLSLTYSNIMGIDICNEPHKLTLEEWIELAMEAYELIQSINPCLLVAVEGVGELWYDDDGDVYAPFWGENLAQLVPPQRPNLIWLPHTYGPSVYDMDYFQRSSAFPDSLPYIWDMHFGHLICKAPLGIGEWGGPMQGRDSIWQWTLAHYIKNKGINFWFFWCLNPNSGDTKGLLLDDWITPDSSRLPLFDFLRSP